MRTIQLDGQPFYLHDEFDQFSNAIVREQDYYEASILRFLERNYPDHQVILDVGANIGNHTAFFARHLTWNSIIAFEPVPENFDLLKMNAGFYGVTLRRQAVGDGDLDVMITIDPENMGACEITPTGTISAHQIKLDNLLVDPVTLIKIDVEWYEPFVLLGAKNLIDQDHPLILIEDTNQQYGDLLPSYYHLIKAWPEDRTYLYGT